MNQYRNIYNITKKTISSYKELSTVENLKLWKLKTQLLDNIENKHKWLFKAYFIGGILLYFINAYYEWNDFVVLFYYSPIYLFMISSQIFLIYTKSLFFRSLWGNNQRPLSLWVLVQKIIFNLIPVIISCLCIAIFSCIHIVNKAIKFALNNFFLTSFVTLLMLSILNDITYLIIDVLIVEEIDFAENDYTLGASIIILYIISYMCAHFFLNIGMYNLKFPLFTEHKRKPNNILVGNITVVIFFAIYLLFISLLNDKLKEENYIKEMVQQVIQKEFIKYKLVDAEIIKMSSSLTDNDDKLEFVLPSIEGVKEGNNDINIKPYSYTKIIEFIVIFIFILLWLMHFTIQQRSQEDSVKSIGIRKKNRY